MKLNSGWFKYFLLKILCRFVEVVIEISIRDFDISKSP